ncbi:hypothetical protein EDD58_101118 [Hazenella coriacea]|uniref:Uncharacterized protein n=2 Tax=Hazenella coriacea TaxID=1179467 RepID=A0A4R3LBB9_9BACL|nr:hypothetical protein EDD58_101118 [Hazenella coriacea]
MNEEELIEFIVKAISGSKELWRTITNGVMEIDVVKNEDFDESKLVHFYRKGFLYSRYYLDIEPNENVEQKDYIEHIGNLLKRLWETEFKAIAACDFEEELPRKGGREKIS